MPHYHSLGQVPRKRHIQFRKPDGSLYAEQLVSTEGFSDNYSNVYHHYPPTRVTAIDEPIPATPVAAIEKNMQHRSFRGFNISPASDYISSRTPVLFNDDCCIMLAYVSQKETTRAAGTAFFKNSDGHEMIFIHEGSGTLRTMYGLLGFSAGDHLIIPRGTIYQLEFLDKVTRMFIVESYSPFRYPKRYINQSGQLLEHAPYCERDVRKPDKLETHDESGDFKVMIKKQHLIYPYHYASHPFDVVGWDGYHYPFALSIHDFEPITGRIHQPPPVHQTFEAKNFVTCAFVPRLYDYHPLSIPVPYNHSNVDSDEVLYYVEGEFMSRKHVERGQITLHPIGIPHGPHPGTVERSLGQKETREFAVMVDTFRPLKITAHALEIEDKDYFRSWLD
jgi:homogentisate 1,2-dioxygenase